MPDGASTAHLYRPKLATVLREGYDTHALRADAMAGLTVAVVALPLSMAIAVASGVSPERGLYAAIVGGLIVSQYLTLYTTPVVYLYLDRLHRWFSGARATTPSRAQAMLMKA